MRFTESTDNSFSIYEDVYISDDKKIHLGNGNDIKIYHNAGGNSNIENHSGDLYFTQYTDDGDIFFRSDDGSGGVTNYLQLDGGSKFVMIPSDSIQFTLGASQDLRLYHNGSNTFMKNYTGTMYFEQHTDDGDMIFYCDDGSGGVTEYFRLDGSSGYSIASKLIRYEDSVKAMFGTGGDFAIQHDGSNTYMTNSVTGHLYIQQSVDDKDIVLQSDDGSGGVTAYLTLDGSATQTLLHQDTVLTATKKLILDGVASSGTYIVESSNDVVDIYAGGTNMLRIEESGTDYVQVFDNTRLTVGTGKDLQIYHDGSNTYMVNYVGSLIFEQQLADGNIIFNSDDGSGGAANYMIIDGGSEIITVHKLMRFDDNVDLRLGAGSDLRLYHTGSHSYMTNYLGDLVIRNYTDDGDVKLESDDGSGGTTTYIRLDGSDTSVDIEQDVKLTAAKKLYLDGGGDTYILETSADLVDLYVGTQNALRVLETSNVAYTYVPDSQFLGAGTSIDFTMSHDATNSKLVNNTGDLYIINNDNDKDIIFQTDDDSGGVTNYLQLDGSELRATFNVHTRFNDSKQVQIGSAADLIIYHDASNTWIQHQGTGNLINYVSTQDADWYVKVNDGGVATNAIQVDASNKGTVLLPNDLQYLKFGVGGDGVLYSYNDDFYVSNFTAGKDTIFQNLNSDSSSYVEIMRLDGSTSRVGIGTNSPDELLEVAGTTKISSTGDTTLYIDGAGNGYTSGCIVFQGSDDDASYRGTGVFNHDAASDIEYFSGTLYANDAWAVCRKTSTSSHDTSVAQGSNALFIIEGGGDVGIGLTNPSYKLHVSGDSYFTDQMRIVGSTDVGLVVESTDGSSMIALKDNSTSGDYYNGIGAVGNELFLKSNNAERVRIDSSGNVGIGTTSPGAKLEVNGTGEFRDILYIAHGGSDYAPNISFLGGSDVAGSNAYENAGIGYYDNSGTGTMLFFGNRAAMNWTWKDDGDTLFHMASGGTFHANADVVAYSSTTSSDKRLKENINPIPYGLEEVLKMNPVEYDWKEKRNKAHDIGVIAQELEKIIPEVVQENKDLNSDKMIKGVDYGKMVAVLIKAIQEQQEEIELLKANYDDLKYNRR